jgi:prepilin-type N-terminal cleavage/methylation domain-containing protein
MKRLLDRVRSQSCQDRGFTLVELLVGMVIFSIIMSVIFTAVMASSRLAKNSQTVNDLNEEARLVLNRMSRELREAQALTAVANPMAGSPATTLNPAGDVSITFHVDFNGNGTIEPLAADPEELTYLYDRAGQRLILKAGGLSTPVLAANVADFSVDFTSRRYQFDGVAWAAGSGCTSISEPRDGTVHWWEIDKYPSGSVGNCDGQLNSELVAVDSIMLNLKVLYGAKQQVYQTTVDLRNAAG